MLQKKRSKREITEQKLTGYPSIDQPWLKYYRDEHITAELPHMTAVEYLEKNTEPFSDLSAFDAFDGKYTYAEFKDAYRAVAASLYAVGVQKGDILLFILPPSAWESILLYAANMIGAVLVGLYTESVVNDICKAIRELKIKKLFIFSAFLTEETENTLYTECQSLENIIIYGQDRPAAHQSKTMSYTDFLKRGVDISLLNVEVKPEDLLFIARTGGTTGEPKNVMINSNTFNIIVHQLLNSDLPYARGDHWLRLWPLFSATAAIVSCHLPLVRGMNIVVRHFPADCHSFDRMLLADKCNHLILVPQLVDVLAQSKLIKNEDLSFIKTIACGGSAITDEFEQKANEFLRANNVQHFLGYGWGCTELGSAVVMRSSFATTRIGTAGVPLVHALVAAFDPETLEEKIYGYEGELCVCTPTIMMGYYEDEAATKKIIKEHPDGTIWLHTGDLGKVDKDGFVTIFGRITRTIFVFPGHKVYPQQLENKIANIDGVCEVAICQTPDTENAGFSALACFIVPDAGCAPKTVKKRVADFCTQNLADYTRPKHIFTLEAMPLTRVGKTNILELEKLLEQQDIHNMD